MNHIQQATSPKILNSVWRYYQNDRAQWLPGVSKQSIEKDALYYLMQLAEELLSGSYQPARLRRFTLTKGNGKARDIAALSLRDKIAQRAVLIALMPLAEAQFHRDSYGYRPGRNVEMAYCRARGYIVDGNVWLVHTDIKNFFDSIPLQKLERFIAQQVRDEALMLLLKKWLVGYATKAPRWYRRGYGLPQGGVLSPLLANWYVSQVDYGLQKKGIRFVRYADDILLCCKTEKEANKALNRLNKLVRKCGLYLNAEKTFVQNCSAKVRFLGRELPRVSYR
jgi:group II intron reverse transcriptase/maturase